MNKTLFAEIVNLPTQGYWSAFGGVEVKRFTYGINDTVDVIANAWNGTKSAHRVRVYDGSEKTGPYIILFGTRLHFNECVRP